MARINGRCGQGRLLDRSSQPLGSPRCAETRPPPERSHGNGIIGKTTPLIQDEPAPPVLADVAENNGEIGSRTWVTRTLRLFPTTPPLTHGTEITILTSRLDFNSLSRSIHQLFINKPIRTVT
ncbi:hypothetical protein Hanom_Chr09g00857511 [Helianthus anomalus]